MVKTHKEKIKKDDQETENSSILWGWCLAAWAVLFGIGAWLRKTWRYFWLGFQMPNPISSSMRNKLFFQRSGTGIYQSLIILWHKYGDLFNLWMGPILFVYLGRPADIELLFSSYVNLDKGILYSFLHPWLGTGLLTSRGKKWRWHRKILTPAFHYSILEHFVPVFNSNSDVFIEQLRARADGIDLDVYPLGRLLTLDVICETAMGVKINAQKGENSNYSEAVKEISDLIMQRMIQPWYYPDFIFNLTSLGRRHNKLVSELHDITTKVIKDREKYIDEAIAEQGEEFFKSNETGMKRRMAFLDLLLMSARSGSGLTHEDIREEVDTFMFEGHDTTATAVGGGFILLARNQDVQEKILKELQSVCPEEEKLKLSLQQLSDLKYLEMVIKECLRIYTPVGLVLRKIDKDFPLATDPSIIPEGAYAAVSPYTLHRDPAVFPDPEKFDPDRFLPENCVGRHPFAYLPFSAGPRNCIGQRFAMLELKSIFAKVIWNFKIFDVPGYVPDLSIGLVGKVDNGCMIRLKPRSPVGM